MGETQRDLLRAAIRAWMLDLDHYPGWREWRRKRISSVLDFEDPAPPLSEKPEREFKFSDEVGKQHLVIMHYLELEVSIDSLKECEFYFRRYPFRGLPVTRQRHIANVCEMYFGRFYEFRERLKKHFGAMKAVAPTDNLDVGGFLKTFDKVFDSELRERHQVHHHRRFEDIGLDLILLTESAAVARLGEGWRKRHLAAYRKVASEWAQRVRRRGNKLDEFLEVVAAVTLSNCSFLSPTEAGPRSAAKGRAA